MKVTVDTYEYVKTLLKGVEIEFPEETFCWQDWNYRVVTMAIPEWTTWNMRTANKPEEIWQYQILRVSSDSGNIQHSVLRIDKSSLERYLNIKDTKSFSAEERLNKIVLDYISGPHFGEDKITVETFVKYYNKLSNKFADIIIKQPVKPTSPDYYMSSDEANTFVHCEVGSLKSWIKGRCEFPENVNKYLVVGMTNQMIDGIVEKGYPEVRNEQVLWQIVGEVSGQLIQSGNFEWSISIEDVLKA